ncbi:hypothetical protein EJB05_13102, partial [Eragrostis curvula]
MVLAFSCPWSRTSPFTQATPATRRFPFGSQRQAGQPSLCSLHVTWGGRGFAPAGRKDEVTGARGDIGEEPCSTKSDLDCIHLWHVAYRTCQKLDSTRLACTK